MKRSLPGITGFLLLSGYAAGVTATDAVPVFRLAEPTPLAVEAVDSTGGPRALLSGLERPLSLAAADLDEDGVPDLVSGYGSGSGGVLLVHRGNHAAIFSPPRLFGVPSPVAPFLSPAVWFDVEVEPSLLATGDFNADGHQDVAAATVGGDAVYLIAGDGRGNLGRQRRIELPGRVTVMLAGEINRRDGLEDLVIGIEGGAGPAALVFEGPRGALRSGPEILAFPDAPAALALGYLDADGSVDLAVGAGRDLWIVHGRDRRLSLDPRRREVVAPAEVDGVTLPAAVSGVAAGDFVPEDGYAEELAVLDASGTLHVLQREQAALGRGRWLPAVGGPAAGPASVDGGGLALVRARVTGEGEELLVLDRPAGRMSLLSAAALGGPSPREAAPSLETGPVALLPMRLNGDALADLVLLVPDGVGPVFVPSHVNATFTVTNDLDSGTGSLRSAITSANSNPGADLIAFNITGIEPYQIDPVTALPALTGPVTIDGYTQPGAAVNTVAAPGASTAVLKVSLDGSDASPVTIDGLRVNGGSSTIRGLAVKDFVLNGIAVASAGNIIEGNYVGMQANGTHSDDNEDNGILLNAADSNTIGGTAPGSRNLISANVDDGVHVTGVSAINVIRGNYIGADVSGTMPQGNNSDGVECGGSSVSLTIGGTAAGAGNVIADNLDDAIETDCSGVLIQGNRLGTQADGMTAMPNGGRGVELRGASATIGGTSSAARNLISGNIAGGIVQLSGSTSAVIQGNWIGTNAAGTAAISNPAGGLILQGTGGTIGGVVAGAGNVISGNQNTGVLILGPAGNDNDLQGNLIGTSASGAAALGNSQEGISLLNSANNLIGGDTAGAGNVISANGGRGVRIVSASSTGNRVEGNLIGTDSSGTVNLGNALEGVYIADASSNSVGGTTFQAANYITANGGAGVRVFTGTGNSVLGNVIGPGNGLLGIDLGTSGVTPNDAGDVDSGANNLQNFPVLTTATLTPAGTGSISGTLSSSASTTFRIEYFAVDTCDPSGNGEGDLPLGTQDVTTNGSGTAALSKAISGLIFEPAAVTATATDPAGNTSEFSLCRATTCSSLVVLGQTLLAQSKNAMGWGVADDVTWVKGDLANVGTYTITGSGSVFGATSFSTATDNPVPDQGLYYVAAPEICGSWQNAPGSEPARDAALP